MAFLTCLVLGKNPPEDPLTPRPTSRPLASSTPSPSVTLLSASGRSTRTVLTVPRPFPFGLLVFGLVAALSGCSYTVTKPPFQATNAVRESGSLSVGSVRYVAAENSKVRPNQLVAKGHVYMETTIEDYVRRALLAELERSGFRTLGPRLFLDSDVYVFGVEAGFIDVEPILDMKLKLRDRAGVRIERAYTLKRLHKFAAGFETVRADLNSMLTEVYEKFLGDPDVVRELRSDPQAP